MAKKTPVKKPKRRLKRSVRRSLAAVLMITAIGVAAIPVPENYAEEEDGGTTSESTDVHSEELAGNTETKGFKFDPDQKKDDGSYVNDVGLKLPDGFSLDAYAGKSDAVLTAQINRKDFVDNDGIKTEYDSSMPRLQASLAITNTNGSATNPDYGIAWQFLYYEQSAGMNAVGVLCKYNELFATPEIEISLYPTTRFFTLEESDVTLYYDRSKWTTSSTPETEMSVDIDDVDPTTPVSFSYDSWNEGKEPNPVLSKGFPDDYALWVADCDAYKRGGETGTKPDVFKKAPVDMTGPYRLDYLAQHCEDLKSAGEGFVLQSVHDMRFGHTGNVYLATGGTLNPNSKAYRDEPSGFIILGTTDFPIMGIGDGTFQSIANVENMILPTQLAYIGNEAFMDAPVLKSINLQNVSSIGNRAFKNCTALETAEFGTRTSIIGQEAFSTARKLRTVIFGETMNVIGYGAFANCSSLQTISFAEKGQDCKVQDYAFYDCEALTNVSMKESGIVSLGAGAFAVSNGASPTSFVLPRNLGQYNSNSIGNFLFAGRTSLEYVVFPEKYGTSSNNKEEIPNSVFHDCVSLQYVEFPCDERENPYGCGFVSYDPEMLFADVINGDFYVKGPKLNSNKQPASPRKSTWDAFTAVSKTVPYLYMENGKEYYEVSDGYYLLCIDKASGLLTSCTFKPGADISEWNGELVIPATVGTTKVTGIASDCFSDSSLNENVTSLVIEDDSITSIANGVFQGGGGDNKKDWLQLQKVYIGDSVESIGANAFRNCSSLVDVTFASPSVGHEKFSIGANAFTTQSDWLTFHGDIVEGYEPFDWAMDPENIIKTEYGLRVCYKSLAPTFLTVMYNPLTDMVTLLDYPKYSEIGSILKEEYADQMGSYTSYEKWREAVLYGEYGRNTVRQNDLNRVNFAKAWAAADSVEKQQALYASNAYGPWIYEGFYYQDWTDYNPDDSTMPYPDDKPDVDKSLTGRNGNKLTDWLFEPIIVYAAEGDMDDPDDPSVPEEKLEVQPQAYFKKYEYRVSEASSADYHTDLERSLIYYTKNITIPAGVDSIDVYGYVNDYTLDGEKDSTLNITNYNNVSTYLENTKIGWDPYSKVMYEDADRRDTKDDLYIQPGLFSGHYADGEAASSETRVRGNDAIESVTMESVKYLPDYAFDSCENLRWVVIGKDLADIGVVPFRGCYALTNVSDNDYYTTENGIIYSNNADGSRTIEECLAARGGGSVGQPVVRASTDPKLLNVSAIKPSAFEDCDNITEVDFDRNNTAGLMVIPEDCFKNCDNLQTVVLPSTTNEVQRGAFAGDNGLTGLTVWGKEVQISARAFDGDPEKKWTTVYAYADSAVVRYVGQYGTDYKLKIDDNHWLEEWWQVSFYDANLVLIEDLVDQNGDPLDNPQFVKDGSVAVRPKDPANTADWTFNRWVGDNNVSLENPIHENSFFYAQGYSNNGMVDGKYLVTFVDGLDYKQVGPIQPIPPGGDAIPPGHPDHPGYLPDGYSSPTTNIQATQTIYLKYKLSSTGGTSGGGTSGGGTSGGTTGTSTGTTSTTSTTSNKSNTSSTSNTSNTSNTSSSNSTSSTKTSSSNESTQALGMYVVTVIGGSGSGTYAPGTTVLIAANTPAAGSQFSKWVTESQGVSLASVSTTPTTFTMPANNVTITAEYTAAAATPSSATGGTGRSGNDNGSTRVDITKPGISNKDLATANVNGSTDNFVVKITETDEATRAVQAALTNKYGTLDNLLYYAMDISLYDSTGTVKITDTSGLSVDLTIPIPDALVAYGGNNMAGAVVNGDQLESLNENFTTINGVPCIRFTATHFSPYTIYVDTGNLTEGMLDTTPKTGDPIHPKWFLSIGLACLSVILFLKKDKNVKAKTA